MVLSAVPGPPTPPLPSCTSQEAELGLLGPSPSAVHLGRPKSCDFTAKTYLESIHSLPLPPAWSESPSPVTRATVLATSPASVHMLLPSAHRPHCSQKGHSVQKVMVSTCPVPSPDFQSPPLLSFWRKIQILVTLQGAVQVVWILSPPLRTLGSVGNPTCMCVAPGSHLGHTFLREQRHLPPRAPTAFLRGGLCSCAGPSLRTLALVLAPFEAWSRPGARTRWSVPRPACVTPGKPCYLSEALPSSGEASALHMQDNMAEKLLFVLIFLIAL